MDCVAMFIAVTLWTAPWRLVSFKYPVFYIDAIANTATNYITSSK